MFDYVAATKAGYSDTEILDYLKSERKDFDFDSALKSGYKVDEIAQYLSEGQPEPPKPEPVVPLPDYAAKPEESVPMAGAIGVQPQAPSKPSPALLPPSEMPAQEPESFGGMPFTSYKPGVQQSEFAKIAAKKTGAGYVGAAKSVVAAPYDYAAAAGATEKPPETFGPTPFFPYQKKSVAEKKKTEAQIESEKQRMMKNLKLDAASDFFKLSEDEQNALKETGAAGQILTDMASMIGQLPMYAAATAAVPEDVAIGLVKVLPIIRKVKGKAAADAIAAVAKNAIGMTAVSEAQTAGEAGWKEALKELPKLAAASTLYAAGATVAGAAAPIAKPVARTAGAVAGGAAGTLAGGGTPEEALTAGVMFGTMHGGMEAAGKMGAEAPKPGKPAEAATEAPAAPPVEPPAAPVAAKKATQPFIDLMKEHDWADPVKKGTATDAEYERIANELIKGGYDAGDLRKNPGRLREARQAIEGGKVDSGSDVQQAAAPAAGPSEAVEQAPQQGEVKTPIKRIPFEELEKLPPEQKKSYYEDVIASENKYRERGETDNLTKLLNRHGAEERGYMDKAGKLTTRADGKADVLMVDIDNFGKGVNNAYGHDTGDDVLFRTSEILKRHLAGKADIVRYGGEEIAVIPLEKSSTDDILKGIEEARKDLHAQSFESKKGVLKGVTFSAGYGKDFAAADAALYDAKKGGRARTHTEEGGLYAQNELSPTPIGDGRTGEEGGGAKPAEAGPVLPAEGEAAPTAAAPEAIEKAPEPPATKKPPEEGAAPVVPAAEPPPKTPAPAAEKPRMTLDELASKQAQEGKVADSRRPDPESYTKLKKAFSDLKDDPEFQDELFKWRLREHARIESGLKNVDEQLKAVLGKSSRIKLDEKHKNWMWREADKFNLSDETVNPEQTTGQAFISRLTGEDYNANNGVHADTIHGLISDAKQTYQDMYKFAAARRNALYGTNRKLSVEEQQKVKAANKAAKSAYVDESNRLLEEHQRKEFDKNAAEREQYIKDMNKEGASAEKDEAGNIVDPDGKILFYTDKAMEEKQNNEYSRFVAHDEIEPGDYQRVKPEELIPIKETVDAERSQYVSPEGKVIKNSREYPQSKYPYELGSWRVDNVEGKYGRAVEQLRPVKVSELTPTEHDVEMNLGGKGDDAKRYATWQKEGKEPPPIEVIESDDGKLLITNGHRRAAAAKASGKETITAWVSPRMDTGLKEPGGKRIYTAMTDRYLESPKEFKGTPRAPGMKKIEADKHFDDQKLPTALRSRIEVVPNEASLPEDWKARIEKDGASGEIHAIYDRKRDKIFVVADALHDVRDVVTTLKHEAFGHMGIEKVIGARMNPIYDAVIKKHLDSDVGKYVKKTYFGERGYNDNPADRIQFAKETLARLAETHTDPGFMQKIIAQVRQLIRATGIKLNFSDNDIRHLLMRGRKAALKGEINTEDGSMSLRDTGIRRPPTQRRKVEEFEIPEDAVFQRVPVDDKGNLSDKKVEDAPKVPPTGRIAKIVAELGELRDIGKMPEFTPYRRTINKFNANNQEASGTVQGITSYIKKKVPDRDRREAISMYREAGGDLGLLKEWEEGVGIQSLKKQYRDAQNLSQKEKEVADWIGKIYDKYLKIGQEHGLINDARDNYITHIIRGESGGPAGGSSQLMTKFKFGEKREFPTVYDAVKKGYEPIGTDAADLLGVYISEMKKVMNTRELIASFMKEKAKDGRPLVVPMGGGKVLTGEKGEIKGFLVDPRKLHEKYDDYESLNHYALRKQKWVGKDVLNNPIYSTGDLAFHPEVYKKMKNILSRSAIKGWYNTEPDDPVELKMLKRMAKGADIGQQQLKQGMLSLSAFHYVQEGTHGVGHRVNPFANIPKIDLEHDAGQMKAAEHGLQLLADYEAMANFREGVGGGKSYIDLLENQLEHLGKIPGVGKHLTALKIGHWNEAITEFLFQQYIPGLKLKTYNHMVERNTGRFKKEIAAGKVTEDDVMYLSARQANAAYGHLNYVDMGRNPTLQHVLRMTLLAPDFLEARARFTGQAIKGLVGGKMGREQLEAIALLAITQYVGGAIINQILDGDPHLDKPFEVIYKNREYKLRSVPGDIVHLFTNFGQFLKGRVAPVLSRTGSLIEGKDFRGIKQPFPEWLQETLTYGIPISFRGIVPGASSNKDVDAWDMFLNSMGVNVSRYSPVNEIYEKVDKWKKKENVGTEMAGVYPPSKYRDLRNALMDGYDDEAVKHAEELMKESNLNKVQLLNDFKKSLFRPYAGSAFNDYKFRKSLDHEDQLKFDEAKKQRYVIWKKFLKVLSQSKKPIPDEVKSIAAENEKTVPQLEKDVEPAAVETTTQGGSDGEGK